MSYKFIELLIIVSIALYILNKLFSILGQVNEDDNSNDNRMKSQQYNDSLDAGVSYNSLTIGSEKPQSYDIAEELLQKFILLDNLTDVTPKITELNTKLRASFNITQFMQSVEKAIPMIINAAVNKNTDALKMLVDPRYIEKFSELAQNKNVDIFSTNNYSIKISDVYFFAHSAFIEISILSKSHANEVIERWSFSKNTQNDSKAWLLSNVA